MNKNKYIEKITSKNIFRKIFEYIQDEGFSFKLFIYSKKFQRKSNVDKFTYLHQFLIKKKINVFSFFHDNYMLNSKNINKKDLKILFAEQLTKNNIPQDIFYEYLEELFSMAYIYPNTFIDIFSPYFDFLLHHNPYYLYFLYIPVVVEVIEKQDLKDDYLKVFNEIKQANIELISILFNFNKTKDIDFLKKLIFDFKIKKLGLQLNENSKNEQDNNFDEFFKEIYCFKNINTMTTLNINLNGENVSANLFEKINDLETLERLDLSNINFEDTFVLKLKYLKILYISSCQNITLEEDSCFGLEELYLLYCYINIPKSLIKLPFVKVCMLQSNYYVIEDYKSILDYASMEEIRELSIGMNEFLDLDCSLYKRLTDLTIYFNYYDINHNHYLGYNSHSIRIKVLKKILLIKTLEKVEIPYINIDEKDEVDGQLKSVTKLNLIVDYFVKDIYNLLQVYKIRYIFPKASSIHIILSNEHLKYMKNEKKAIKGYKFHMNKNLNSIKFQ